MVMPGNLGSRFVRIAAFIVGVLVTASTRGDADGIHRQLERLKVWKEDGLLSDPVYTKEVLRLLRKLDNAPAGNNIPTGPLDPALPLPKIDWTVLKELFDVSNLRTGSYHNSDQTVVPVLIFDVKAKFSFTLATASFVARLYDKDNKAIGGVRTVKFEREFFVPASSDTFIFWNRKWPRGGGATAYISLYQSLNQYHKTADGDMDPGMVHKIIIIQGYSDKSN